MRKEKKQNKKVFAKAVEIQIEHLGEACTFTG